MDRYYVTAAMIVLQRLYRSSVELAPKLANINIKSTIATYVFYGGLLVTRRRPAANFLRGGKIEAASGCL